MDKHESYSVRIHSDDGKFGTGVLFYSGGSRYFYVMTCAHVIHKCENADIRILVDNKGNVEERVFKVNRENFRFSALDNESTLKCASTIRCDVAVIRGTLEDKLLDETRFYFSNVYEKNHLTIIGYPEAVTEPLYYAQIELAGRALRVLDGQDYFIAQIDERNINSADRLGELQGISGSPVWNTESLKGTDYLLEGLVSSGVGSNLNIGRIKVMNSCILRDIMKNEYGINIESVLPFVSESETAPGYLHTDLDLTELEISSIHEDKKETLDQLSVRNSWIESERRNSQMLIDSLQLKKAIESARRVINNSEFEKCNNEQKYGIYAVMLEAYRLAREYETYDDILQEIHERGISNNREILTKSVRYHEALELEKALKCANLALRNNPDGLEERVISLIISAELNSDRSVETLSGILGSDDRLLIKPKDSREEEVVYQMIGYVLVNRFHETGRAIRCLNRAYRINGNPIILETLGIAYYFHSLRDAYTDESKEIIDPNKINVSDIEKAREALLRVLDNADDLWLQGSFKRAGLLIFKCFYFLHDNFRVYKLYQDIIRYCNFPNRSVIRDVQCCYLETLVGMDEWSLEGFDALTDYDKRYFSTLRILEKTIGRFHDGLAVSCEISQAQLLSVISDCENEIKTLNSEPGEDRGKLDRLRIHMISLYGNGILRYGWNAVTEVERHMQMMTQITNRDQLTLYLEELKADNIYDIENKYADYYEQHKDIASFGDWVRFYIRHGLYEKAKELYDSVFTNRKYLIVQQTEYFYREYVIFCLYHKFDITPAISCFVKNRDDFKDIFIAMSFRLDLEFASTTFNNPDKMIADLKMLSSLKLYSEEILKEKCLIIDMLNCRFQDAKQYASWANGGDLFDGSQYEAMLLVGLGMPVIENTHWKAMRDYDISDIYAIYHGEEWLYDVFEILKNCNYYMGKSIVVDLWTLYLVMKSCEPELFNVFDTIYITHSTVSMALCEIRQVNDMDIRRILINLQSVKNVKFISPTLEQQMEIRKYGYCYNEADAACLMAKILNCPAVVGEFRYQIHESLKERVIRPIEMKKLFGK